MTVGRTPLPDDPPELVYWPFGSIGVCQLLVGPYLRKRVVLLEKFTVEAWVRAVKTYRIRRTGVQPAILRMLLDADVAKEDLASLEYLPGVPGRSSPSCVKNSRPASAYPCCGLTAQPSSPDPSAPDTGVVPPLRC